MLQASRSQVCKSRATPLKVTAATAVALFVTALSALPAAAQVTVTATNGTLYQTSALSSSTTNGAQMDGMLVTATFVGGSTQTLSWADLSATTGGVTGTGWSLSNTGATTYDVGSWNLSNTSGLGMTSLVLNGAPGNTIFDRTFGGAEGTTGSSAGLDFAVTSGLASSAIRAEYTNRIRIGTAAPVGDIFTTLAIFFNTETTGLASGSTLRFSADTDNAAGNAVITVAAPEPGSSALLLTAGIPVIGLLRRRKRGASCARLAPVGAMREETCQKKH